MVTHSEGYIHKSPFPLPGHTFQAHVSKKTQRQFPNTTGSAYLTILPSLCFLIQCFSFATTEVRDYRAGSRGGCDKCRSTKLNFLPSVGEPCCHTTTISSCYATKIHSSTHEMCG